MALPTLDAVFASAADQPRRYMLSQWLVNELGSGSVANYVTLPERYLWAKIAVAAGALKTEADYISLPKQYVWKAIYDAVSGSSAGTTDWSEKQALGRIAAAYRGDTSNPANLATYIDWPWRYQVASIITAETTDADVLAFALASGATDIEPLNTFVKETKDLGYWDDMVFWPMKSAQNAGTGTTLYSLGGLGTFNGTLVNGPTWDSEGILFGEGSGKRIDLPASSDLATGTGNYTFEQWVKVSSDSQFAFWETNPIGTSGTRENGWILYYNPSGGEIGFYINGANIIFQNFALPLNEWFHVALVRNGSTTTIYKNGTSVGSTNEEYDSTAASGGSNFGTFCDSTSLSPDGLIGSSFFYKGIAKYTSNFMLPTML
jgi:hypothetical protein